MSKTGNTTVIMIIHAPQVAASGESMYDDAFTIQYVEKSYVDDFNYVAGMVPFLLNLVKDVSWKLLSL